MDMGLALNPGGCLDAATTPAESPSGAQPAAAPAIQDIALEIQTLLLESLLVQVDSPETDLLEAGSLDSLTLVQLLFQLEERFGIKLPLDELEIDDFRSIGSIARLVAGGVRTPQPEAPDPA